MSKRYIDADMLKSRMFNYYECVNENTSKSNYNGETLMSYEVADMIEDCIDNAPTADVVEVRHGEWINSGFCNSLKNCMLIKCSECDFGHFIKPYLMDYDGVLTFGEFKLNTHYCQNCGAKMDGERKSEND